MRNAARWPDNDLVFTTQLGTPLDAANVRRAFRQVAEQAGLNAAQFRLAALKRRDTDRGHRASGRPREHPYTEKVYRKELRPVLRRGAKAMDELFKAHYEASAPRVQ